MRRATSRFSSLCRRDATVLALLLLLLPAVPAQVDAAALQLATDPSGDASVQSPAGPLGPAAAASWLDLTTLQAAEGEIDITLSLSVVDLASAPAGSSTAYTVWFRHQDRGYLVVIQRFLAATGSDAYVAELAVRDDGTGRYSEVAQLPLTVDEAAGTFTVPIGRHLLQDSQGAAPYPGRLLDQFRATAAMLDLGDISTNGQTVGTPDVVDRMPDGGESPVPLPIRFGLAQSGNAALSSDQPFRASNGQAGTFVFHVNATNRGPAADLFRFNAVGLPAGWDMQAPAFFRLEAGQKLPVAIVVRTAFAHQHGSAATFVLEMASQSDPGSVGRLRMGLTYLAIPQPAGHHDTVYLHSLDYSDDPLTLALGTGLQALAGGPGAFETYMNTLAPEDDERDDQVLVQGRYCGLNVQQDNDTVGSTYCWEVPLQPGLELGLDFDLGRNGTYRVPIKTLAPAPGMRVQGRLVYLPPIPNPDDPFAEFSRERIEVATLKPSPRQDLLVNAEGLFEGQIVATEAGDFIPYLRGSALALELEAVTARPDNFYLGPKAQPELRPGGMMTLPLFEYEDPVGLEFQAASAAVLSIAGEASRLKNPGQTAVYNLTLRNDSGSDQEFLLRLVGSNLRWGAITAGGESVRLASGSSAPLQVAVRVPVEALDGDRADLVFEAASASDLSVRALARIVTTTDTDAQHVDEAALAAPPPAKQSPAPGALALSFLLALMALALRRRKA